MMSIVTVTVPAVSQDLTVLATVKNELGITSDTNDDAKLAVYIKQASDAVSAWCRRVFGQETVSETFRPSFQVGKLILDRRPVSSITSVTEDGTALSASDYELDAESGMVTRLYSDCQSNWSASKITVVYVAGYELLDSLPHSIEKATILLVKNYYYSGPRDPLMKSVDIPGVMSESYWVGDNGSIPDEVADLLGPYRDYT